MKRCVVEVVLSERMNNDIYEAFKKHAQNIIEDYYYSNVPNTYFMITSDLDSLRNILHVDSVTIVTPKVSPYLREGDGFVLAFVYPYLCRDAYETLMAEKFDVTESLFASSLLFGQNFSLELKERLFLLEGLIQVSSNKF